MISIILFCLTVAGISFADEDKTDFPPYKEEFQPIYQKLEKPEDKPNDLNNQFIQATTKKAQEITKFIRTKKDELMKEQQKRRKDFEDAAKKELAEWRAANPKESASQFMRAQGEKRKALTDQLRNEMSDLEGKLAQKKNLFEAFLSEVKKDFREKFKSYVTQFQATHKEKKPEVDNSEFKEIPKGKGTVLAPGQKSQ